MAGGGGGVGGGICGMRRIGRTVFVLFEFLEFKGLGSLVSEPRMGGKRRRDADGNTIPWASDAKQRGERSRADGTRPARENGTEHAQLVAKRATPKTDEAVEQLQAVPRTSAL